jgi:hypothetical protein
MDAEKRSDPVGMAPTRTHRGLGRRTDSGAIHRERLAASLLLLILAETIAELPRIFSLSANAWGYPNYRPQLWFQIANLTAPIVGILMGGLSDPRSSERDSLINDEASTD